jgi:HAD superfamily hydrolase (TIGR01490 family)
VNPPGAGPPQAGRSPPGGQRQRAGALALFDLDHTLLPIDSDHAWGEFMIELGWVEAASFRRGNDDFYAQYLEGRLDIAAYIAFATAPLRARSVGERRDAHARFMSEVIVPALLPAAEALVRDHRERGDRLALVTSTNDFVTAPIAAAFAIDTLIATRLELDGAGAPTGRIAGLPAYREGKVARVGQWLAAGGSDWRDFERISVYSDSLNDLALLEKATDPVATNPSPELAAVARERGWRILTLFA